MVRILKLGGSVITEKTTPRTVDRQALERASRIIGDALADTGGEIDLALVHGGGSFGHPVAAEHGLSATAGSRDATAVLAVHRAMVTLNETVVDELHRTGVPALPVHPLSVAVRQNGDLSFPTGQVATMLAEGFVPVVHGDVVVHAGAGATVLGGDDIVAVLARDIGADSVGLCSNVPGVLDDEGAVIPEIDSLERVAGLLGESAATDVTGGMAGKVATLLDLDCPAQIFSLDSLASYLETGQAGTTVR